MDIRYIDLDNRIALTAVTRTSKICFHTESNGNNHPAAGIILGQDRRNIRDNIHIRSGISTIALNIYTILILVH